MAYLSGPPVVVRKRGMPVLRRPSPAPFSFFAPKRPVLIAPPDLYGSGGLSGLFSFIGKAAKKVAHVVGGAAKGVAKGVGKVGGGIFKVVGKVAKPVLKVGAGVAGLALPGVFGKAAQVAGTLLPGDSGGGRSDGWLPAPSGGGGGGGGVAYGGGDDGGGDGGGGAPMPVQQASMFGGMSPLVLIGLGGLALFFATRRRG